MIKRYLLEEGKQVDKDLRGLVRDYSLQLKNIHKQTGNKSAYEKELWSLMLQYQKGNLDIFNELKILYPEEEWKKQREIIFNKLSNNEQAARLYESEMLYDRLLQAVLDSPDLYTLRAYENKLKKLYPQELLSKYEAIVRDMASRTSDRKRYREIVPILRTMKKIPRRRTKSRGDCEGMAISL